MAGACWWPASAATCPQAREYIWSRVREGYYRHGIRVWWLDACEPELRPAHPDNLRYRLGPGLELIIRWFQFGVFSPLCRLHGFRQPEATAEVDHAGAPLGADQTGAPNELWSFGDFPGDLDRFGGAA